MSIKTKEEDGAPINKPQIAHSFDDKRRTGDILSGENLDFAGLFLSPSVLQGLSEAGFRNPSPIQLKAIPLGRCGLDLIVQAKSGTGKTCVFTVIALEGLLIESCSVQVLILAPTREIALQIQDVIVTIGQKVTGLTCHSFIGGLPLSQDKERVKKCHIAVGTPGRVKQLIEENILTTDSIRLFVLDEADKLLEEGFQEQINWIYSTLPDNKQMVALSATYPEYLANHLTAYMRNPTFVRLNVLDPALLGIKQFYQEVPFQPLPQNAFEEKSKSLIALLSSITFQQCLVFSNLQVAAENLSDLLNSEGWPSAFIAGSQDQKLRMKAMEKLKKYECRVLISTDLTSRGIDADKVDLVVNLDLPWDHETYLHRIGRAGRFGAYGAAVSFVVSGKESTRLKEIEKKCQTVIKPLPDPIPSNLTQPIGHVGLDDMVTTEQLITIPKANSHTDHAPEKHGQVKLVRGPSKGQINGDAVLESSPKKNGNKLIIDVIENGSHCCDGNVTNGEANCVDNEALRKQVTGTDSVVSTENGFMNGHDTIVEGDVRSEDVIAVLRKEEESVAENGPQTLNENMEEVGRREELGLMPSKDEAGSSTGLMPSKDEVGSSTGLMPSKDEVGSSTGLMPSKDEVGSSTGLLPSKDEVGSSTSLMPSKDEVGSSTGLMPSKDEVGSSTGLMPSKDEAGSSTGLMPSKDEVGSSTGLMPSKDEAGSSTGLMPSKDEAGSSTGLMPSKDEVGSSTTQTGAEARVEDVVAFEELASVSNNEETTLKKVMEQSFKDGDVNLERGLANADSKPNAVGKKERGKTIAYSSRELRSYCDLDFDVSEQIDIPEFGVESSGFGVRSAKSGGRSAKFSDQFAWSKPTARSKSKASKSDKRNSYSSSSKQTSGSQATLSGDNTVEISSKESVDKLSRLEKKLGVEFVSKLVSTGSSAVGNVANSAKASSSMVGNADRFDTGEASMQDRQQGSINSKKVVPGSDPDSVTILNGLESEIPKPVIDEKLERKKERNVALSVPTTISKYFTNNASDQIEKQKKKVYYSFAEAQENFLKFGANGSDLMIKPTVSSSAAMNMSPGATEELDVTLTDITCLLNEFHRNNKTILSSLREKVRHSVAESDGVPESSLAANKIHGTNSQEFPVESTEPVTPLKDHFPKSVNKGTGIQVEDTKLDLETSALSSDQNQSLDELARVHKRLNDSDVAQTQENSSKTATVVLGSAQVEIAQSHPPRPIRKRRPPSEEKKRRGMAGTLAMVQGRVEPIAEEDANTSENEQTCDSEQTSKCVEPEIKTAGSLSGEDFEEKPDLISHQKSRLSDQIISVSDKKSFSDLNSGVTDRNTSVSMLETGNIERKKTEAATSPVTPDDASQDDADGDDMFIVQDGVVLRVKRTLVSKNDPERLEGESFGEEAEEHVGEDDDDDGSYSEDSDSTDSGDDDDESESYSDSETDDSDASESEPDFVEEVGGLCYRRGYSQVEQRHTQWCKRLGVDTEVSALADLDADGSVKGDPQSLEEYQDVDLSADTEVCPEPVDLSVRPKTPLSAPREKAKRTGRCYHQTEHSCHGNQADSQDDAFGDGYSKIYEDPNAFHEKQGHFQGEDDYRYHNNQFDQPRYHGGNYSNQYQTGTHGNQYHQGYDGSYGNQHQYNYHGNRQNHNDYTCYKDSPHYQDYLYHVHEAERLEQKMKDEAFNKKMEVYMHKAYVIQHMCMDQMKQFLHCDNEN